MGDMLTLIEQAEQAFDADQKEKMAAKIGRRDFTLEDFLEQMLAVRRMGPIGNMLGMLPGHGADEGPARGGRRPAHRPGARDHPSMTPAERADPKIINGSRRLRIANGSGVDRHRRQPAGQPVLRGPQDDEADGRPVRACRRPQRHQAGGEGPQGQEGARARPGRAPGPAADARRRMPDLLARLPPGARELPTGLGGLDQLPPGFDPSKLKFPKGK